MKTATFFAALAVAIIGASAALIGLAFALSEIWHYIQPAIG